jgi:hypothetical protein
MKINNVIILSLVLSTSMAYADGTTIADIANRLVAPLSIGSIELMGALAYIFGIALAIKGILKLKEVNESKGQVKLNVPIIILVAAVFFLMLPTLLKTGENTLGLNNATQSSSKY